MLRVRAFILVAISGILAASLRAQKIGDILVPLNNESLLIDADIHFTWGNYWPGIALTIQNQTSHPWEYIRLQIDAGGICDGAPSAWSFPVAVGPLGWDKYRAVRKNVSTALLDLKDTITDCTSDAFEVRVLRADFKDIHINNEPLPRIDMITILAERKKQREAEQAKHDAAVKAQDARDAAEQKRRAELAKQEQERKAAEYTRIKNACTSLYRNTANKKISDLTVAEDQQVRACQALGLYSAN